MTSTPTSSAAAATGTTSPSKANGGEKSLFSEKESKLLTIAMAHCLKSGPPEIDYQKFVQYGEFNTMKTAQNTWGKIKQKLKLVSEGAKGEDGEHGEHGGEEAEGDGKGATPKTPKTAKTPKAPKDPKTPKATTATPGSKKRGSGGKTKAEADAETDMTNGDATEENNGEEAEGSPKKKPRKAPAKKASPKKKNAAAVKAGEDETRKGDGEVRADTPVGAADAEMKEDDGEKEAVVKGEGDGEGEGEVDGGMPF